LLPRIRTRKGHEEKTKPCTGVMPQAYGFTILRNGTFVPLTKASEVRRVFRMWDVGNGGDVVHCGLSQCCHIPSTRRHGKAAHRMPASASALAQDARSGPRLAYFCASVTAQPSLPAQTHSERPAVRFAVDVHKGGWVKPCSASRRLASRDSPGYRRSRSATAALGWTGNDGNSAGPFSLRTLAIVHGARGSDALGCVTCTPKRAATRMTVAQSLSHQSFSRDRPHAMGLGLKSRLPGGNRLTCPTWRKGRLY
jgi:hypothetical protein